VQWDYLSSEATKSMISILSALPLLVISKIERGHYQTEVKNLEKIQTKYCIFFKVFKTKNELKFKGIRMQKNSKLFVCGIR